MKRRLKKASAVFLLPSSRAGANGFPVPGIAAVGRAGSRYCISGVSRSLCCRTSVRVPVMSAGLSGEVVCGCVFRSYVSDRFVQRLQREIRNVKMTGNGCFSVLHGGFRERIQFVLS